MRARLILDPPRDAAANMAADEALFVCAVNSPWHSTLRVYGWAPHAISLGRRQKRDEVDMEFCRGRGLDVVRRPGGGAAVYHGDDVTYSYTGREEVPSHLWRRVFLELLSGLGIKGDAEEQCKAGMEGACFSSSGFDEPLIGGRKFVGNSRRRSRGAYMQHGSILLESQPAFMARAVKNPGKDRSVGLCEAASGLGGKKVMDEFIKCAGKALGLQFENGGYTSEETEVIARLIKETGRSPL